MINCLESVLEVGGLDAGLVKTEPEDLTGRHRHDTEVITLSSLSYLIHNSILHGMVENERHA